jgi:hypothetical protein
MKKTMTPKQIEANRRNAQKSTGPKTPDGQAVSKMNALKHGILSREAVVRGRCIREDDQEFAALHQRLQEDLQPAGALEEMLVDQIATTHWRLRRVLKAESGEIALSVDNGQWERSHEHPAVRSLVLESYNDPAAGLKESALGNRLMKLQLQRVRASVEKEGELTEAAIQSVMFRDRPYSLTEDLEKLRSKWQPNPGGADAAARRELNKLEVLRHLDRELATLENDRTVCEKRRRRRVRRRRRCRRRKSWKKSCVTRRCCSGSCTATCSSWNDCNAAGRARQFQRR